MEYYLRSHVGKVRTNNEDFVGQFPICEQAHIFIVSDGMGGHNKGEAASRIATNTVISSMQEKRSEIKKYLEEEKYQKIADLLTFSIRKANQSVYEEGEKEEYYGMGTTMVAAVTAKDMLMVANVGDSRCYIIRRNRIKQLTRDNSFVQELVESGAITKEEALTHSQKNVITRAIGTDCDIKIDTYEFELEEGDILILCSDGLTNMITEEEILRVISSEASLEQKSDELIGIALENGGLDNISLICIKYDSKVGEI